MRLVPLEFAWVGDADRVLNLPHSRNWFLRAERGGKISNPRSCIRTAFRVGARRRAEAARTFRAPPCGLCWSAFAHGTEEPSWTFALSSAPAVTLRGVESIWVLADLLFWGWARARVRATRRSATLPRRGEFERRSTPACRHLRHRRHATAPCHGIGRGGLIPPTLGGMGCGIVAI